MNVNYTPDPGQFILARSGQIRSDRLASSEIGAVRQITSEIK